MGGVSMSSAIRRTRRVVSERETCPQCRGIGSVRAGPDAAEVMFCPRCGGTGVEPPPLGDSILWPQGEGTGQGADGRVRGELHAALRCTYARRGGATIVRASGEIDLHNVHRLADMLDLALTDSQTRIVEMAEVSYIDSTGLNMLIRLHEQCARRNMMMAVVFTSEHLRQIFAVLSLQDVFRIFPTVEAALRVPSHAGGPERLSIPSQEADIAPGRQA